MGQNSPQPFVGSFNQKVVKLPEGHYHIEFTFNFTLENDVT